MIVTLPPKPAPSLTQPFTSQLTELASSLVAKEPLIRAACNTAQQQLPRAASDYASSLEVGWGLGGAGSTPWLQATRTVSPTGADRSLHPHTHTHPHLQAAARPVGRLLSAAGRLEAVLAAEEAAARQAEQEEAAQ